MTYRYSIRLSTTTAKSLIYIPQVKESVNFVTLTQQNIGRKSHYYKTHTK